MRTLVLALIIGFSFLGVANAGQDDPPAPCGPAAQLPAELSNNVGADARCFEIRMYTARPPVDGNGGIDELHQRFRDGEVAIFEKHGAEIVAVWQNLDNPNRLVWMLAYRDRAHREEVWAAFRDDPGVGRAPREVPRAARGDRGLHAELQRLLQPEVTGGSAVPANRDQACGPSWAATAARSCFGAPFTPGLPRRGNPRRKRNARLGSLPLHATRCRCHVQDCRAVRRCARPGPARGATGRGR